ncbi:MAG TPA: hypothetical protein VKV95_02235 [Terriglobia bacterium]|nr:hypothetical protein [Terriglobia bacterium]
MDNRIDDRPAIDQERRVLRAFCKGDRKVLDAAAQLLAQYKWREPVHQIIFNCLTGFPAGGPLTLRERLAACATRKGFPDVDWEEFFPPIPISDLESNELLRQLLDLSKSGSSGR